MDASSTVLAPRRLSELRDADVPFWAVLGSVVLVTACLLCCCTCFVVRCFAPENRQGPAWETNSSGKRWVRRFGSPNGWLGYADDADTRPDLTPIAPPSGVGKPRDSV